MEINQCYKILNASPSASDEEIMSYYKKLAQKYHPDKNRDRVDWANDAMTQLNLAYSTLMSYRFKNSEVRKEKPEKHTSNKKSQNKNTSAKTQKKTQNDQNEDIYYNTHIDHELFVNRFVKIRETAKESLYKYFQYNLNNFVLREKPANRSIFNDIVRVLKKCYHSLNALSMRTTEEDKIEHSNVFNNMIFNFYKASECINIIDSYKNQNEVAAYRAYKRGDDILHSAHKEVFFDRHNRGSFKSNLAYSNIIKAIESFHNTLTLFPGSSWAVETKIKLEYALSLKNYIELFFTED